MNFLVTFKEYTKWHELYIYSKQQGCYKKIFPPIGYQIKANDAMIFMDKAAKFCHNCKSILSLYDEKFTSNVKPWGADNAPYGTEDEYVVLFCKKCSWWCAKAISTHKSGYDGEHRQFDFYEGILKKFCIDDKNLPIGELKNHFLKKPELLRKVNPTKLEVLIADLYKEFYNCEVRHIGGPNDNGVDVFAIINDEPHLIQVKRRFFDNATEPVSTVRELVGALITSGINKGHIVTTAPKFSPASIKLIKNDNLIRYKIDIELRTFDDIVSMLSLTKSSYSDPWEVFSFQRTIHFESEGLIPDYGSWMFLDW
jgi:hypothetical protein